MYFRMKQVKQIQNNILISILSFLHILKYGMSEIEKYENKVTTYTF